MRLTNGYAAVSLLNEAIVADFHSARFGKDVWVTHHARESMRRRGVNLGLLQRVIEEGEIKRSSAGHLWVYLHVPDLSDKMICVAVTEVDSEIVKKVMINWELRDLR